MSTLRSRKFLVPLLAFLLLDLLAVGAGMGVPIFAIPFGFLVGWFAPGVLAETAPDLRSLLRRCQPVDLEQRRLMHAPAPMRTARRRGRPP